MAQLRHDYPKFVDRETEVIVIGPEGRLEFKDYWEEKGLPFIGLPDPSHKVLSRYGQEVKLLKLGRMPAQAIVDKQGVIRFASYGSSMQDIPSTDDILALLDVINQEQSNHAINLV